MFASLRPASLGMHSVWLASALLFFPLMNAGVWRKKRRQDPPEEQTNREGRWTRDFSVRSDSWPIIEHWAREMGFHLIAMKARRRMYVRGADPGYYQTFLDIRHDESRVVLTAWIQAGFKLRALLCFLLPAELPVEAHGLRGARARRRACRDLNALLTRLRQREIAGSLNFHLADIDVSTLALSAAVVTTLCFVMAAMGLHLEVRSGLSNILLTIFSERVLLLIGAALGTAALHHYAVGVRRVEMWKKAGAASGLLAVFAALSLIVMTRTGNEMRDQKISYYCLSRYDEARCRAETGLLSQKERIEMRERIQSLESALALRH